MPTRMPLIDTRMVGALEDFFSEECTIRYSIEDQSSSGSIDDPLWADFAGHISIPCRKSPVRGTEVKQYNQTYTVGSHVIELMGYYPTIDMSMVAVVNLIIYDILAVEFDGEHKLTRLSVEIAT